MKCYYYLLAIVLGLTACQKDYSDDWKPLNLLEYGLPVTLLAPDSAQVEVTDLGLLQDVKVEGKADENYSIQIYASEAETNDISRLKADQLTDIKDNRLFSRIVREEEQGFIYETRIDSSFFYSFRYVHVKGDKELIFTTGLADTYQLEEVEAMYNAVKENNP